MVENNFVDPQLFYQRKSEIEIIGGFSESKLKFPEILAHHPERGWVHVCYLKDLPAYLADNHYNTPGHRRISK